MEKLEEYEYDGHFFINLNGKEIEVDEDGYLKDFDDWSENLVRWFAKKDGIDLISDHWQVIRFLRRYYRMYQICPMIKILIKEMGKMLGPGKDTVQYFYKLFSDSPAKMACRYAGTPKPTGMI